LKTIVQIRKEVPFILFNQTKTLNDLHETARFTVPTATCCSTIQMINYFLIAVKTIVTRTRQIFQDL